MDQAEEVRQEAMSGRNLVLDLCNYLHFFLNEAGFLPFDLVFDGLGCLFFVAVVVPLLPPSTCCLLAGIALALSLPTTLAFFARAR